MYICNSFKNLLAQLFPYLFLKIIPCTFNSPWVPYTRVICACCVQCPAGNDSKLVRVILTNVDEHANIESRRGYETSGNRKAAKMLSPFCTARPTLSPKIILPGGVIGVKRRLNTRVRLYFLQSRCFFHGDEGPPDKLVVSIGLQNVLCFFIFSNYGT